MSDDSLLDLTSRLVRIPSINPPGAEQPVADVLAAYLADRGIEVTCVPSTTGRPNLIARIPGRDPHAPARIFTGHMDVVPVSHDERGRWTSDPFSGDVRDGRLWGRGSTDMKGGLAAAVRAACSLVEAQIAPARDVLLVFTSDEEDQMTGSKTVADHPLLARDADVVVCEPTGLRLCTTGRGRTWARLALRTGTGHGSQASAPNAVQRAAELIGALARETFPDSRDGGPSFWRPLAIHAGVEPCVVPDVCEVTIDARLDPDHDPGDVWRRVERLVAEASWPDVRADLTVIDSREGWRTNTTSPLVTSAKAALAGRGLDAVPTWFPGTTDGTVLRRASAAHGVRDVIICGPGELGLAHRENENVLVADLRTAEHLYRGLMTT